MCRCPHLALYDHPAAGAGVVRYGCIHICSDANTLPATSNLAEGVLVPITHVTAASLVNIISYMVQPLTPPAVTRSCPRRRHWLLKHN